MSRALALLLLVLMPLVIAQAAPREIETEPTAPWERDSIEPDWADNTRGRTLRLPYDPRKSAEDNGAALWSALTQLQPGDTLKVSRGTYSIDRLTNLVLRGTERKPIWVIGAEEEGDEKPVITRPDARQNVLNIASGDNDLTEFACIRGFEFTGGSSIMRIYNARDFWVDRCEFHNPGAESITANTRDTERLFITRNHLHHMENAGATCEGMYLGANNGKVRMSYSVIAENHVHDCRGTQGDGIEVKQGSHHNWIVGNTVHDTNYPCILVYGTDGNGVNVIERNTCWGSGDNTIQVQGEAIVRNNLIMAAKGSGFASTDHQGKTCNLAVVHNTIITSGRGMNLSSWNDRDGMLLANNVVYSERGEAIRFPNGAARVTVAGNVTVGNVVGITTGFTRGDGLDDFVDVAWDGSARDAHPVKRSAPTSAADRDHLLETDLHAAERKGRVAGAFAVAD